MSARARGTGDLCAIRVFNWKIVFLEQRAPGGLQHLRGLAHRPRLHDGTGQFFVASKAQSLAEFPRRQKPASFTIDKVFAKLQQGVSST